jgi:hypothetical protein
VLAVSELTLDIIDEGRPLQNHAEEVNEPSTKHSQLARPKVIPIVNAEANGSFINHCQLARIKAILGESETYAIDSQFYLLHMEGLAPFDIKDKDDKLNVTCYITDMFQHSFHKEVTEAPFECSYLFQKN